MTLAAVLVLCFLSLGYPSMGCPSLGNPCRADPGLGLAFAPYEPSAQDSDSAAGSQAQTPPAQNPNPAPTPSSAAKQKSAAAAKPAAQHRKSHKKTAVPDCSTSATPLQPTGDGNPASSTNTESTNTASGTVPSSQPVPASSRATAPKPCPPPIVVIKNGGSNEPTVELKGDTTAEKASQQRYTTEQLTSATEENLKKIAGRQLSPSQQQMVDQIKDFMEQSKQAIAAGDLERGNNLAMKARLLSDELVKP